MKWYTCTPVPFKGDHTFFSRDSGAFCKAFQRIGLDDDPPALVGYQWAWDEQRRVHAEVVAGRRAGTVLLLEHESVYTAGRRTLAHERPFDGTPVIDVDRGGKITWHGPGQLVGYPIIGLAQPPDVVKFTTAYARLAARRKAGKKLTIVVGRDARISGEMVADLVEGTLLACGANVINVGLCTTPGVEMAVITHKADGGIIITASHNPRQWNALKLLNADGEFLSDAEGKQVLAMAEEEDYEYPTVDGIGRVLSREPFNERHIAQVLALPLVDAQAIRARRYKVVVDAVNSVGGIVMPELLRRLGCEVVELNCDPTGEFAHNPEPLPENLTEIAGVIRREKADLGIVVDPDVDRLALVSEDGSMFVEEYTLVAVADYILTKHPGGNSVSNLSSSRALRSS